jgi:hypothetical protein
MPKRRDKPGGSLKRNPRRISIMSDLLEVHPPVPSSPRPFQFTLRTLFIFSFLFAIVSAGIFCKYDVVRYLTLLVHEMFWFYLFLAWAIYARGYLRTFGIGASISFLFPWIVTGCFWYIFVLLLFQQNAINIFGTKTLEDGLPFFWPSLAAILLIVDSIITGGTMVLARWLIDRSRRQEQIETPQVSVPECTKS